MYMYKYMHCRICSLQGPWYPATGNSLPGYSGYPQYPAILTCSILRDLSTLQLGTYLGYPRYPGILSIQGSGYTLQLGTYLGYPRYPGILSIQGSGYIPCNLGRTWDIPGIPGYLVFRDLGIPCNLGRTWDIPGIPGYLVFRDLGIYLATWDVLGMSPVSRDT